MLVDGHFAVERETFHRGAFENGGVAVLDVVEDPRLADEISGVDPVSVAVVFLEEGFDAVGFVVDFEHAEFVARVGSEDGEPGAGAFVEGDFIGDVCVGHAVAVGEQETLVADVLADAPDASAGHGVQSGVDHGDAPVFAVVVENFDAVVREVDGHIAVVAEIVGEVFLDDVLFVSAADDEIFDSVVLVRFHDVPYDRFSADFDHRFRNQVGGFAETRSEASGKDDSFHFSPRFVWMNARISEAMNASFSALMPG